MQTDNRFLDDLARVATGALSTLAGVREEAELRLREQLEKVLARLDLVTREEFDAVQALAAEARAQQEQLAARLAALEALIAEAPAAQRAAKPRAKPAAR